jgi:hypothetical protein
MRHRSISSEASRAEPLMRFSRLDPV